MSDNRKNKIPEDLREELQHEPSAERAELEHIWQLLGDHPAHESDVPDADETWVELERQLTSRNGMSIRLGSVQSRRAVERPALPHRAKSSRRFSPLLVAAVVAGVLAIGALAWWVQPVVITPTPGQTHTYTLPDGSAVELGGGSELSYTRGFSLLPLYLAKERKVTLEGEAFFDVVEGDRSFIVETFNARIEVIGTQFDVQAWSEVDDPETRVALASGQVRVASKSVMDEEITLHETGHVSRVVGFENFPTPARDADINQVTAWRQQGFYASDQSLSAIILRLEHRFDRNIRLQASGVGEEPMTLFYPREVNLETILSDISVAKGLKYRPTSDGYEILHDNNSIN